MADQEFKTTIINTLRVLMDKVNSMQEQMSNESRDEIPKKEKRQNARDKTNKQTKKPLREMKSGSDELSREGRSSELEYFNTVLQNESREQR